MNEDITAYNKKIMSDYIIQKNYFKSKKEGKAGG